MGFLSLLVVAMMPVLQLLIISLVGAILASKSVNVLPPGARKDMNKVVFFVFAPALIFGSLVKTITLQELISWWFMPVNIGFTFLVGGSLGWAAVKMLRPEKHLEGLIIANCSAGNLGYMLLIIIPAVCNEEGSPFGESGVCTSRGLAYNSLSMALGGFFIWTHTYSLMKKAGAIRESSRAANDVEARLLKVDDEDVPLESKMENFWGSLGEILRLLRDKLMAPPTIAAILGFAVGVMPCLNPISFTEKILIRKKIELFHGADAIPYFKISNDLFEISISLQAIGGEGAWQDLDSKGMMDHSLRWPVYMRRVFQMVTPGLDLGYRISLCEHTQAAIQACLLKEVDVNMSIVTNFATRMRLGFPMVSSESSHVWARSKGCVHSREPGILVGFGGSKF